MASSYNRRSNSSASNAKPAFRRAGSVKRASAALKPVRKRSVSARPASKGRVSQTAVPKSKRPVYTKQSVSAKRPVSTKRAAAVKPVSQHKRSVAAKKAAHTAARRTATARAGSNSKSYGSWLSGGVLAGLAGAFVVVSLVVVFVLNSGLFAATDIKIKGSEHMTESDVMALIEIPANTSLFNVDEDAIVDSLKQNPWVSGVSVERTFPHTLTITPTEHKVAAIAYVAADDLAWAISEDRTWIAPVSLASASSGGTQSTVESTDSETQEGSDDTSATEGQSDTTDSVDSDGSNDTDDSTDTDGTSDSDDSSQDSDSTSDTLEAAQQLAEHYGAVLLTDVPSDINPTSGEVVTSKVVSAGLDYALGFSDDFIKQIKNISVSSVEAISANLTSGVEVSLGSPSDISKKERIVNRLLSQEQGVTYINVRSTGSYTFRSAPTS